MLLDGFPTLLLFQEIQTLIVEEDAQTTTQVLQCCVTATASDEKRDEKTQLGTYLNNTVLTASFWKQQPDARFCPYPDILHYIQELSEMRLMKLFYDMITGMITNEMLPY